MLAIDRQHRVMQERAHSHEQHFRIKLVLSQFNVLVFN